MVLKKPFSDEELEALLKLAENEQLVYDKKDEDVFDQQSNDILRFMSTFDLKPGKELIKTTALYYIYTQWSHEVVTRETFTRRLSNHIPNDRAYFKINLNAINLEKSTLEHAQKVTNPKTKSKNWKIHIENFLTKFDIKNGGYWIEDFQLYYLYDKWCYEIKKKGQLNLKQFGLLLDLYIDKKRRTKDKVDWYKVDKNIIDYLSNEKQLSIREARMKKNGSKKNKKNEEKERNKTIN